MATFVREESLPLGHSPLSLEEKVYQAKLAKLGSLSWQTLLEEEVYHDKLRKRETFSTNTPLEEKF